jgi:hypothetical protein
MVGEIPANESASGPGPAIVLSDRNVSPDKAFDQAVSGSETGESQSMLVALRAENDREREDDFDDASVLSTSSRSMRLKSSIRRRMGDSSSIKGQPSSESQTMRSRRASAATSEDDTAALGTRIGLALQDAGKEGGSWGVGDEVRMGLE